MRAGTTAEGIASLGRLAAFILMLFTVFVPQFDLSGTDATAPALLAAGVAYIAIEFVCACGDAAIGGHIGVNGLTRRARRTIESHRRRAARSRRMAFTEKPA